jgi:hypothetical protein
MKRDVLLAIVCALLVAGCAYKRVSKDGAPDPTRPEVFVVAGRAIVVSPEPLVFTPNQRDVTITWRLPKDSPYTFPQDGIVIKAPEGEFVRCAPSSNGKEFSCLNRHTKFGKYPYVIKVLDGGKPLDALDPFVLNM